MTQEQIQEQIAKFEKGLTNPNIPESAKETIKKKIEDLKSQIQKVEEVIEKKEEKIEKEEKAAQEDLEEVIKKFEKGLSNPNIPETAKDAMRKKIAAAKEKLAEAKKEMKEDKVEAEKEKKEIKKAVEKVEQLAKKAKKGKTPKKPAKPAKVKVEHKKREAKAEKRKSKIKGMTEDLMKIIRSNKYLKEKYAGKNVDLERDAHRAAKPFGYRFKGEHDLRDPKEVLSPKAFKSAVKSGRVYFEGRPNRSDKYPKGVPKHKSVEFADGGMMALNADDAYAKILAKAKEYDVEKGDLENLKKEDVKKLIDVGYNMEDLYIVYIGVKSEITFKCDDEVSEVNGIFSVGKDYVERIITSLVEAGKEKKYELGLKYPLFNWSSVIKKYNVKNEPILIQNKRSWGNSEYYLTTYEIFVGDNVVFGHEIKRARYKNDKFDKFDSEDLEGNEVKDYNKINAYQKERDSKAGFNTGYWGIVSSDKSTIYDITKMIVSQKDGYVKDLDFFYNRLGGVGAEELDKSNIKYEDGGMMADGGAVGKSVSDKHRFAKPAGYRWKDKAVKKGVVTRADLAHEPSKKMRKKYPNLTYFEDRLNKADAHPTRSSKDSI